MKEQKTLILRYAEIALLEARLAKEDKKLEQRLINEKNTIGSELSLGHDEILKNAQRLLSSYQTPGT